MAHTYFTLINLRSI